MSGESKHFAAGSYFTHSRVAALPFPFQHVLINTTADLADSLQSPHALVVHKQRDVHQRSVIQKVGPDRIFDQKRGVRFSVEFYPEAAYNPLSMMPRHGSRIPGETPADSNFFLPFHQRQSQRFTRKTHLIGSK